MREARPIEMLFLCLLPFELMAEVDLVLLWTDALPQLLYLLNECIGPDKLRLCFVCNSFKDDFYFCVKIFVSI